MKGLIVTAEVPYPPASGGSLRVWGLLTGLHAHGYELTVLSCQAGEAPAALTNIAHAITMPAARRSIAGRVRTLLTSQQPDIAQRLFDERILQTIIDLIKVHRYDFVQFEGIETACYLPPLRRAFPTAKLVFDTFNAEAVMQHTIARIDLKHPRRWPYAAYSYVQSRRIAAYEAQLCREATLVFAVSEEDQAHLKAYATGTPICVVPSGIHTQHYTAPPIAERIPNLLVFTGKMDYRPNVDAVEWFVGEVMPRVPQARLQIVGQQPTQRVQRLASDRVEVTGRVPQVQPYLQQAAVYIAPLRMGSGTRLKLLEAMASGCAIVATPLAASGLTADVRRVVLIAEGVAAFADAVQRLLDDAALRTELGLAARQFVCERYDWSAIVPQMIAAHQEWLR